MPRKDLENNLFDCVIIGGGIVGSGLFREQALHGIKTLIIDQADFNSQTSQSSSKMLHGGIRYLEQFDFALVFEALKEKNIWLKLAPHLTREMPLYLPIYKFSKWPLFALRIGLFLYDLLSLFKNTPHKIFNKNNTLKILPGLMSDGLSGAGMYYDGLVDDAKLGLECIYDGLQSENAYALNYHKLIKIESNGDQYLLTLEDTLTKEHIKIHTKMVQFATGPFTDQVMKDLDIKWDPVILPSKGSHLWLKKDALKIKDSMVLQTKDNRIIFVIPSRNSILVGTTEIAIDKDQSFLNIRPSKEEIDYLLQCVNEYFPSAKVNESDVLSSFAGIRPLVREGLSSAKTSRKHKIFSPIKNVHVIVGGKYTTFRKMAEELNQIVFKTLGIKHDKSLTLRPLKRTSIIKDPFKDSITQESINKILEQELVRTKEDLIKRRLSLPSLEHLDKKQQEEFLKIDIPNQLKP